MVNSPDYSAAYLIIRTDEADPADADTAHMAIVSLGAVIIATSINLVSGLAK